MLNDINWKNKWTLVTVNISLQTHILKSIGSTQMLLIKIILPSTKSNIAILLCNIDLSLLKIIALEIKNIIIKDITNI